MSHPGRRLVPALTIAVIVAVGLSACGRASRLRARCLSGDVQSCSLAGDMYTTGQNGTARDMVRAAEMYERACAGGMADICNTLGETYERTGTVEGGVQRAEELFQRACEGGSSAGCLNLGLAFAARDDKLRALELYERSCNGGWSAGCHHVGLVYDQGDGVPKDSGKAMAAYTRACDGDYVESCVVAGDFYARADSPTRDVPTATRLYGKALAIYNEGCQAGTDADCVERDRMQTRITMLNAAGTSIPRRP
jgi:TPR repeat protein